MKRNTSYPEYEEHKNFRLTDEQRPYFGLDVIDKQWQEVEIKEGTTVFYDGDIIRKIITWENFRQYEYTEFDTELITRDRQFVLPKTAKGKEKKITPTNLLSFAPTGCRVYISLQVPYFKSQVLACCPRNSIKLPITGSEGLTTISELKEWLETYIQTCPDGYFDKVQKMRTMAHRTVKYSIGDIFRFEIDREHYGFGLIIGKLRDLLKQGVFPEGHPMHSTMTVPLLIRLYTIKTKDKNLSVDEIAKHSLLPADLMCDNEIIWGTHEIVGNKKLCQNDIDFPIQIGYRVNKQNITSVYLAWGPGVKIIEDIKVIPEEIKSGNFRNDGVSIGLPTHALERVLQGESEYNKYSDILHPDNFKLKSTIYEIFNLPLNIDIDVFNKEYNGMTRNEYITYVNSPL